MFHVIFDMDGTLFDTQRICIPAWESAGLNQGIKGLGNDIPLVCGMNETGWMGHLTARYPNLDMDRFNTEMRQYIAEHLVVRFMPGAEELLSFLKQNGVKTALASGSSKETIAHHLKAVSAVGFFDAIVGGEEVENGKPAPDIFLTAAERLGADAADCFVFEDSANGIKAGYSAGMKCIGVPDVADFKEDVIEMMFAKIDRLDEAIELLKPFL